MNWIVKLHTKFEKELDKLSTDVQDEIFAHALLLAEFGPQLGRPHVDTLKGSRYSNMKELRFRLAKGVFRIAFAFDPQRQAILLVGNSKSGTGQMEFYKKLIKKADKRFSEYLLEQERVLQ